MADVFDIASTVTAWLDAGHDVLIGRVLASSGLAGREAAAVAAWLKAPFLAVVGVAVVVTALVRALPGA